MLLSIHLAMNLAAVRAVKLLTINRQRANIILSHLLQDETMLSPEEVSRRERIFEWDGILRWRGSSVLGRAQIGVTLQQFLENLALAPTSKQTGAVSDRHHRFRTLLDMHEKEDFLMWFNASSRAAQILLKDNATSRSQIKAWAVLLSVSRRLQYEESQGKGTGDKNDHTLQVVQEELRRISVLWPLLVQRIEKAGFDLDVASLETSSNTRIRVLSETK